MCGCGLIASLALVAAPRSVEQVLSTGDGGITLSTRANTALDEMRCEMPYFDGQTLPVVRATDSLRLWTFAGGRANAMLANQYGRPEHSPRSLTALESRLARPMSRILRTIGPHHGARVRPASRRAHAIRT
jgi:hypothetical protein